MQITSYKLTACLPHLQNPPTEQRHLEGAGSYHLRLPPNCPCQLDPCPRWGLVGQKGHTANWASGLG